MRKPLHPAVIATMVVALIALLGFGFAKSGESSTVSAVASPSGFPRDGGPLKPAVNVHESVNAFTGEQLSDTAKQAYEDSFNPQIPHPEGNVPPPGTDLRSNPIPPQGRP